MRRTDPSFISTTKSLGVAAVSSSGGLSWSSVNERRENASRSTSGAAEEGAGDQEEAEGEAAELEDVTAPSAAILAVGVMRTARA